jgi:hypothetical protein
MFGDANQVLPYSNLWLQVKASLSRAGVSAESASRQARKVQNLHEWCLWVINLVITTASLAVPWAVISVTEVSH